ncbi:hypothetical protein VTK73DRAFT_927 [Phialemonium thermophilum]|uniref:Uncharacterized protein n=1 Tax=Phialemonium thermophilum TaxID=223376 RepID=A0ABR3VU52_9PEZI
MTPCGVSVATQVVVDTISTDSTVHDLKIDDKPDLEMPLPVSGCGRGSSRRWLGPRRSRRRTKLDVRPGLRTNQTRYCGCVP